MKKMKPISQKREPWGTFEYQVVLTMAKYGNSPELTFTYYFTNIEMAVEWYNRDVAERCKHQTCIDTSAVIGLYRGEKLLRQMKVSSYIG